MERVLINIVSKSPLHGCQLTQHKHPQVFFNAETINACLHCCKILLQRNVKSYENEATNIMQRYNSIECSHYFPVCENYFSLVDKLLKKKDSVFQSKTEQYIRKCVDSSETENFDFLTLWEQSSIANVTEALRTRLEYFKSLRTTCKLALVWLEISDCVVNEPLKSCHRFFSEVFDLLGPTSNNLHSIVNCMSIYSTIILSLMSCTISSSSSILIVIPHMYYRALLVYESLITGSQQKKISNA